MCELKKNYIMVLKLGRIFNFLFMKKQKKITLCRVYMLEFFFILSNHSIFVLRAGFIAVLTLNKSHINIETFTSFFRGHCCVPPNFSIKL